MGIYTFFVQNKLLICGIFFKTPKKTFLLVNIQEKKYYFCRVY